MAQSLAIMNFLQSLPFVGVVACSNTTLDDLAFIHLQLSLEDVQLDRLAAHNSSLRKVESTVGSPGEILLRVFSALGYSNGDTSGMRLSANATSRMWDYATLVGALFPIWLSKRRRAAVWFSWQSSVTSEGLSTPLGGLYRVISRIGTTGLSRGRAFNRDDSPNIEYLVCRQLNGRTLRGKGKLSIPKDVIDKSFSGYSSDISASRFCSALEALWRDELRDDVSVSDIAVSWRESWFGKLVIARVTALDQ